MTPRWALITGASSGIGRATAEQLAAHGMNLILLGRRTPRLQEVRTAIVKAHAVQVEVATVDIQVSSQVAQFAQTFAVTLARVDVLINNAGLAKGVEKLQDGDTNVKGLLYVTRAVLPFMLKNGRGHIVNIGSVAGRWVYPNGGVYCATKFAVRALSEGLRMDLAGTPLRVTNIEPGMVETEFSLVRFGDAERAKSVYQGMTPLTPKDIAETITWCLERPAHVNIQELVIFPTDQAAIQQVHRDSPKPL
jgi:3-hydroxy acid dehydrogenase/malonic semialdehyde reductase